MQRGNNAGQANDQGEVEVTMLQYPEDSIGPAIEEDVAVFVTQQRALGLGALKGSICQIKKKNSSITMNLLTTT